MNNLRNSVKLIGRLGMDPEVQEFKEGRKMARFTLATNENYKNKTGEWVTNTTWHKVIAWGNSAALCERILNKGKEIMLEGKLVNSSFENKKGDKVYVTEVELDSFISLSKEKSNQIKA